MADQVGQGAAIDQGHGQVGAVGGLAELKDWQNGRMFHAGRAFGFFAKLLGLGGGFNGEVQKLEGHDALDGGNLDGSVNGPLAAGAQLVLDHVVADA